MNELFEEILGIEAVRGVMLLSPEGKPLFNASVPAVEEDPEHVRFWAEFIERLAGARESELVFGGGRLYARRTDLGTLLVVAGRETPMAMVRLSCDVLLPRLQARGKRRGWRRILGQ